MTVSLGFSLVEGAALSRRTQNEIVVSWITLWGMIKVYWLDWLDFSLHFRSCCLLRALSPFLTGRMFLRPNILRTLRQTMIRFLTEHLVRRIWFGQSRLYFILKWLVMRCKLLPELAADAQQTAWWKCRLKSSQVKFNHPSQGNSTNAFHKSTQVNK